MSSYCPVCNGMKTIEASTCPGCSGLMEDCGKYTDFFDKYSAYEDIETVKLSNGVKDDHTGHLCAHMMYCRDCRIEKVVTIDEKGGEKSGEDVL
ncbi:hypothetical protein [Alteribacter natronophilus]|uniref:hypothetical protein n=1 Tax=Alteribacter natronophilus TaxID=2583810 RepID=UPI00110EC1AF|nr:hypothetical protein [Alteribacter natronophilus]TMW70259.1 hypothetical protein FGB90_16405 [Alteribacter natronophilus]